MREIEASLGFARPGDVMPDTERPGLLRVKALPMDPYSDIRELLDCQTCVIRDTAGSSSLNLETMGFDRIDLTADNKLQATLEKVRLAGELDDDDVKAIRRGFLSRTFRLENGKRLRFLYVAPEGFIMRKAGPNGLKLSTPEQMTEKNNHDGALAVHGDQDVKGTPVKQILKGFAPWLFRHQAPDSVNRRSPVFLLNIWVPLQQLTRPLCFMDRQTLDQKKHQLRYGLPVEGFLDRDEGREVNDIWMYLHHDSQRWYYTSDMDASRAYVFDTLGIAHGACVTPGETLAEQYYLQLLRLLEAVNKGDADILRTETVAALNVPEATSASLRDALTDMKACIDEVLSSNTLDSLNASWKAKAEAALDRVVRKSIEMRAVALVF